MHLTPESLGTLDQHRKVIKSEWAFTRISTFNDHSQTYEVMNRENGTNDKSSNIQKIFAIASNFTTLAYDPLKHKFNKIFT